MKTPGQHGLAELAVFMHVRSVARRWVLPTFGMVGLLALVLRLFRLTGPSLWFDEGGSLSASSRPNLWRVLDDLARAREGNHFQPLYFAVLHVWRTVLGSSVCCLRVLSVIFGLAALVVLVLVAARAFGVMCALISAVLISTSAFFVGHAQEARPYALLLCLSAALLYLFVRAGEQRAEQPLGLWSWLFWACLAVSVFASMLVAFFAAGLALGDLLVGRRLRTWLRTWVPCVVTALPALAFYLLSTAAAHPGETHVTQLGGSLVRNAVFAVYGVMVGSTYGPPVEQLHGSGATHLVLSYWPTLLPLAVVALVAVIAALHALRGDSVSGDERSLAHILIVTFVVSYAIMFVFALATRLNWQPRHSFFLALPLFLLLPFAARSCGGRRGRAWRWVGGIALGLLVVANLFSLGHAYFDTAYARDDYRDVARYLVANRGAHGPSLLLYGVPDLLRYYGDSSTIDAEAIDQERLAAEVEARTDGAPAVVLVSNREWAFWTQPESVVQAMAPRYRFVGSVHFPYFIIYRFSLAAQTAGAGLR